MSMDRQTRRSNSRSRQFLSGGLLLTLMAWSATAAQVTVSAPSAIEQVVAEIGSDPLNLIEWMSGSIRFEPYQGAMRGAVGTLAAGGGSAADQALLTHALLSTALPEARLRFATCDLDASAAGPDSAPTSAGPVPRPNILLEEVATLVPEIAAPDVRAVAQALADAWNDLGTGTAYHAVRLADALAELEDISGNPATLTAHPDARYGTHVWVQLAFGEDWLDLDPTAAERPGARCVPASTSTSLPPELLHTLIIAVVVEDLVAGLLQESMLITATVPLTELESGTATFAVAEAFGDDLTGAREPGDDGLLRYTPLLLVGDERLFGDPFYLPSLAPEAYGSGGGGFGGLGAALGGILEAFGDDNSDEGSHEGIATGEPTGAVALWLDLTLTTPQGTVHTRAPVFDRLGYAARQAGETATAVRSRLPELEGEYLDLATVWSIGAWTGRWSYGNAPAEPGEDLFAAAAALGAWHSSYEVIRQALMEAVLDPDIAVRPAGSTLSLLGWRPSPRSETMADLVMDVRLDPGPRLASQRTTSTNDHAVAATWAVASVMAERALVDYERLFLPAFGEPVPEGPGSLDLLAVLDAAWAEDMEGVWLEGGATLPPGASAEARARVAAHLANGARLYLPAQAVMWADEPFLGWWLLGPVTTEAAVGVPQAYLRDELETGRHQAGEYTVTTQPSRTAAPVLRRSLGQRLICTLGRAIFVLDFMAAVSGQPGAGQVASGLAEGVAKVEEAADKTRRAGRSASGSCSGAAGP